QDRPAVHPRLLPEMEPRPVYRERARRASFAQKTTDDPRYGITPNNRFQNVYWPQHQRAVGGHADAAREQTRICRIEPPLLANVNAAPIASSSSEVLSDTELEEPALLGDVETREVRAHEELGEERRNEPQAGTGPEGGLPRSRATSDVHWLERRAVGERDQLE